MNIKERAKKLKSDIPAVFIALKDKDTPLLAKIVAGITVGYALSPVDLIPDFIPFFGLSGRCAFLTRFSGVNSQTNSQGGLVAKQKKRQGDVGKRQTEKVVLCNTNCHCMVHSFAGRY